MADRIPHPRRCARCNVRHHGLDLIAYWCWGCWIRLPINAAKPLAGTHVAMRCERCDLRYWTAEPSRVECADCVSVHRRWRDSYRICRGCSGGFRPNRSDMWSCTPGCSSILVRERRMAAARRRGVHTPEEWSRRLRRFDYCCAYCGVGGQMTKDHVRPITRGGSDAIRNILPACPSCNSTKGNRMLSEMPDSFIKTILKI